MADEKGALDPAGPPFENSKSDSEKLDKTDAKYVDVIHTYKKWVGLAQKSAGRADFWPNGGEEQPGCKGKDNAMPLNPLSGKPQDCSHIRAILLYTESIRNDYCFRAYKCDSYSNFKKGKCFEEGTETAKMGYYYARKDSEDAAEPNAGDFYLDTYPEAPFCGEHVKYESTGKSGCGKLQISETSSGNPAFTLDMSESNPARYIDLFPRNGYNNFAAVFKSTGFWSSYCQANTFQSFNMQLDNGMPIYCHKGPYTMNNGQKYYFSQNC